MTTVFWAHMESERFTFDGFGATHAAAIEAINDGFEHHLVQCDSSLQAWMVTTAGGADRPSDFYEAEVIEVQLGSAYRDGQPEELKPRDPG